MVSSITNTILDDNKYYKHNSKLFQVLQTQFLMVSNITNTILNGYKYYQHNSKWFHVLPTQF